MDSHKEEIAFAFIRNGCETVKGSNSRQIISQIFSCFRAALRDRKNHWSTFKSYKIGKFIGMAAH